VLSGVGGVAEWSLLMFIVNFLQSTMCSGSVCEGCQDCEQHLLGLLNHNRCEGEYLMEQKVQQVMQGAAGDVEYHLCDILWCSTSPDATSILQGLIHHLHQ